MMTMNVSEIKRELNLYLYGIAMNDTIRQFIINRTKVPICLYMPELNNV
jgi:hypothetical protein